MKQTLKTTLMCLILSGTLTVESGCTHNTPAPMPETSTVKLKPTAQQALHKVLSEGLQANEEANEDISWFLQNSSDETRYIMRTLTNNECYLGDGHSILRRNILPSLCQDLDELLQQEPPSPQTLDRAVWMATKLELTNLISFLVHMGAPADKYQLGM